MDLTGRDIENCNGVREELKRVKCKTSKREQKTATSHKINATKIIKEGSAKRDMHTQIYGLLSTVYTASCANKRDTVCLHYLMFFARECACVTFVIAVA